MLFISLIPLVSCLWANDLIGKKYNSRTGYISFSDSKLEYVAINLEDRSKTEIRADYEVQKKDGLSYLVFTLNQEEQKWLMLYSEDILILYSNETDYPFFIGIPSKPSKLEGLYIDPDIFSATSELKKGETIFSPKNLGLVKLDTPWVEGVNSVGIGESIEINSYNANSFILSNGFVSYRKPHLFRMNSRLKMVLIEDLENNTSKEYSIPDSPDPVTIRLEKASTKVRISILDVYPGEKWEDTCVNFILIKAF